MNRAEKIEQAARALVDSWDAITGAPLSEHVLVGVARKVRGLSDALSPSPEKAQEPARGGMITDCTCPWGQGRAMLHAKSCPAVAPPQPAPPEKAQEPRIWLCTFCQAPIPLDRVNEHCNTVHGAPPQPAPYPDKDCRCPPGYVCGKCAPPQPAPQDASLHDYMACGIQGGCAFCEDEQPAPIPRGTPRCLACNGTGVTLDWQQNVLPRCRACGLKRPTLPAPQAPPQPAPRRCPWCQGSGIHDNVRGNGLCNPCGGSGRQP